MYYLQTGIDNCDMNMYQSCPAINETQESNECAQQCVRPCERLTVTAKEWTGHANDDKTTQFRIYFDNMNMITFDEQYAWSLEEFVGMIGGIVDLILGYSIFDMICFTFLILPWFF